MSTVQDWIDAPPQTTEPRGVAELLDGSDDKAERDK